ncbi:Pentatricopeptide repeat-containing protein [Heracleum sosnowskyi]|uniref:Pentatricopeptide repeat-containing protein n=1 Tax=Heracleum sosnowskyi TaxID=360622 RepID=A0AAD8MET1_9APIA|nr:Pentatricopeptide repeat-containing protein [Heracleum sosnowskyi]
MNNLKQALSQPQKNTTHYYNSIINRLSSQGAHTHVLQTYISMFQANDMCPDAYTYPSLLKSCTFLNLFSHGVSFHQQIIVNGFFSDAYVASSLINFYAKFGYTELAHHVFDEMSERNVVPWTAMIGCYAKIGKMGTAFCMYKRMVCEGVRPSSVTMLALLSGVCEDVLSVECLFGCVVKYGFDFDLAVVNSLMSLFGKCGRVEDARELFESMGRKDIVSWNSLVSGYALMGNVREVKFLVNRMRFEGMEPDHQTFGALVSATARQNNISVGKLVHSHILTSGFELDVQVKTLLISMYLKVGYLDYAYTIFEQTLGKDTMLWTTMISGLVQNDFADRAIVLFREMLSSGVMASSVTVACALAACAHMGALDLGTSIHGYMIRREMLIEVPTQNSLVTMYSKCGHLEKSCIVFDMMDKKDIVSWNAIVSGHAQNGDLCKAMCLLDKMRLAFERPDSITIVSLLQACAAIGAYHQGKWIHSFVIRNVIGSCILVDTTLVDMYSKCGNLESAKRCFDRMLQHDVVSWSTIISGYGSNGKGETALELYEEFLRTGLRPNHVIFLSVLSACSHNGLVDHGIRLFHTMTKDFQLEPKVEHCACIVDLLCRARRVEDAHDFYKKMFAEPVVDVLGILLDACRSNGKAELGETIAQEILMLQPGDAGNYMQLAHNYASTARWDDVGEALIQMRSQGLKKLPGWSFFELQGTITTFFTDHSSHPQYEEIVALLMFLSKEIRKPDIINPKGIFGEDFRKCENDSFLMQELLYVES